MWLVGHALEEGFGAFLDNSPLVSPSPPPPHTHHADQRASHTCLVASSAAPSHLAARASRPACTPPEMMPDLFSSVPSSATTCTGVGVARAGAGRVLEAWGWGACSEARREAGPRRRALQRTSPHPPGPRARPCAACRACQRPVPSPRPPCRRPACSWQRCGERGPATSRLPSAAQVGDPSCQCCVACPGGGGGWLWLLRTALAKPPSNIPAFPSTQHCRSHPH